MNKKDPTKIEYWKEVFPNKTDKELEYYMNKWGKENPKYLHFPKLESNG